MHNFSILVLFLRLLFTMAWISSGATNNELVRNLLTNGVIKSNIVAQTMQAVDRADYSSSGMPYADNPNPIGHGQTISAPHMHAQALEVNIA